MKILRSIRDIYDEQSLVRERLKEIVDLRIGAIKNTRWHYESRVKGLQSFALKIESGRFRDPRSLEDFFACTLVVTNSSEINSAESLILSKFSLKERRPLNNAKTHKRPEAFPFDDLRLYVYIPENPALPLKDTTNIVFEVQIKTFLQHAWSIATHDLIYKADDANWAKERIAFQTKAMLEHAEISIQEAERLSTCQTIAKEDQETSKLKSCIALLRRQWQKDELPEDTRRLAVNINRLLELLKLDIERLEAILNQGKEARSGKHPLNLSPYAAILQYLLGAEKDKVRGLLQREVAGKEKHSVLVPSEIEMPADFDRLALPSAIFLGNR